jgi:hypothetical protein
MKECLMIMCLVACQDEAAFDQVSAFNVCTIEKKEENRGLRHSSTLSVCSFQRRHLLFVYFGVFISESKRNERWQTTGTYKSKVNIDSLLF